MRSDVIEFPQGVLSATSTPSGSQTPPELSDNPTLQALRDYFRFAGDTSTIDNHKEPRKRLR
jgi:hypothetical protein